MTIKRTLVFLLLGPLAVVFAVTVFLNHRSAIATIGIAFDHSLADDARALATQVRVARDGRIAVDLPASTEAILRTDSQDEEFFSVWDQEGRFVFGDADLPPLPSIPGEDVALSDATLRGLPVRRADYSFLLDDRLVRVAFAETTTKRDKASREVLFAMVVPNLLLIATSLAVVYFGIGAGLSPLRRLGDAIAQRSQDDLALLPEKGVPREAMPLIDAMNRLIRRLDRSVDAQRRFVEDAAHQLRTPMTALQTQLELALLEHPGEPIRRHVTQALAASKRLNHASHQLLALARSSSRDTAGPAAVRTDLAGLISDAASDWFDLAERSGVALAFQTRPAPVFGFPWLLGEMMTNLVENAILHSRAGASVTVRCDCDARAGTSSFAVEDDGPGVPLDERARIFDRFYRGASTRHGGGSGLGLAIVQAGCRVHGATVSLAEPGGGHGSLFRIDFPPMPSAAGA